GVVALHGTNTYSAGTYNTSTLVAGSDQAFGSGTIELRDNSRLRNNGAAPRTLANEILLDGGDNSPRYFGQEGTGELRLGNLHFKSANANGGLTALSTVTFTNVFATHDLGKGGDGAAIVKGDIVTDAGRQIRVTSGMLALTGGFVNSHRLNFRGPTATLGWSGARGFILDTGNDNAEERLSWAGDGNNPWEQGGGFSGYGGDLDVTLAVNGNPPSWGAPLEWGVSANFVRAGHPLAFGHAEADGMATLVNDITLNTEAANTVNVLRGSAPVDGCFAGNLTSGGGAVFVKDYNGVLSLAGPANAWLGATVVRGGVLRVDGGLSGTSEVLVEAAGALCGTGTLATASVVVDGAFLIEPGAGAGLTVNGNVAIQSNGVLRVVLDGGNLRAAVVNGTFAIDEFARLELVETPGFAPPAVISCSAWWPSLKCAGMF
ncbi:MAG: hypothetical protein FWF96_06825, partial [Kiritimatiellaeota bacterium]|nr:hypothetical protein [Kiritimatiellota bacterium]